MKRKVVWVGAEWQGVRLLWLRGLGANDINHWGLMSPCILHSQIACV